MKYAFIKAHRDEFSVRAMCRVLKVHASGFYAWLKNGLSRQAKRRRRLTGLIKQSWLESGCVYGYRKVHHDLLSLGEPCARRSVINAVLVSMASSLLSWRLTSCSKTLMLMRLIRFGSLISLTAEHTKVGCIWPPSLICIPVKLSDGLWAHGCRHRLHSTLY